MALQSQVDDVLDDIDIEEETQKELSDVELRLEEANRYRALLNQPLFKGVYDQSSIKVEKEVRSFIKEKLRELVGLKVQKEKDPIVSTFSKLEIEALKALAARVLPKQSANSTPVVNSAKVESVEVNQAEYEEPKPKRKKVNKTEPAQKELPLPNGQKVIVENSNNSVKVNSLQDMRDKLQRTADIAMSHAMRDAEMKVGPSEIFNLIKDK